MGAVPLSDMAGPDRDTGRGIARATVVLMAGALLSRALGLAREQLAAGAFGADDAIAAFTVADNLQALLFDLLAAGALQAALIPVLARLVMPEVGDHRELRHVGGALLTWALLATGAMVAIGMLFAPQVVGVVTAIAGENGRGAGTDALAIDLLRIVLPSAVLLAVATVLQAMLHAIGAVTAPALATACRNVALIVAILVLADGLGVESMAWGTLVGSAVVVLVHVWPLWRRGALPVPNLDLGHPEVRRIARLYAPVLAGLALTAAGVVIDRGLAWGAGDTAVGAMRYATTVVQLVLGLVAAALSLASLPVLARHAGTGDAAAFDATLSRVLGVAVMLMLPATVGAVLLAQPMARLLFGHGAMTADGVDAIALALRGYAPGMLAAAVGQVLLFACYARQRTAAPVVAIAVGVGAYLVVALTTVGSLGMIGLVLANSAQHGVTAMALALALRRMGVKVAGPGWARSLRAVVIATVMFGVVVVAAASLVDGLPLRGIGADLAAVGIPALAGGVAYAAVLHRLGDPDLAAVVGRVRTHLTRAERDG